MAAEQAQHESARAKRVSDVEQALARTNSDLELMAKAEAARKLAATGTGVDTIVKAQAELAAAVEVHAAKLDAATPGADRHGPLERQAGARLAGAAQIEVLAHDRGHAAARVLHASQERHQSAAGGRGFRQRRGHRERPRRTGQRRPRVEAGGEIRW